MAAQKFENQPYYADAGLGMIIDSRLDGVFATELPATDIAISDTISTRRWDIPLVNRVNVIKSNGRDGEMSSGDVGLVDIVTPEKSHTRAIRSWLGDNETGIPVPDCSWSVEFDDPKVAQAFWSSWIPSFNANDVSEAMTSFLEEHPEAKTGIRGTRLGLLNPWYEQREGDSRLLERYSTVGGLLVHTPREATPVPDLTPGVVYKVPQREWWTTKVSTYAAKTCLAAFVMPPWERRYFGDKPHELLHIQWANGQIDTYNPETEQLPAPLRTRNLAKVS